MTQKDVVRVKTTKSSWNREHFTIDSTDGILGAGVFSAAAWPRMIEEATVTVRTNKMALKLTPAAEDTGQHTFLARFSLILKLTPLSLFARGCEEYKHLADSTNLGLVYAISCSFLSLSLCTAAPPLKKLVLRGGAAVHRLLSL